ncbi:sigma-70 family RNA polymerase sigma factor [Nocardioides bruguierae]|uniref:FliA/WhiG family RNA polymerase sigma factor n=1 Tax=Nocardioides bruguierae TaxID=2945102 RepID=A0A9X2DA69_9ACTN|nr:FliA/WhiG family RNA polymerase sigma factor [Nocardioides bruguierae]MCM0621995.1 FliA/WhiG family RNA polymerase sigma factor [Nocardioides bruguierae]
MTPSARIAEIETTTVLDDQAREALAVDHMALVSHIVRETMGRVPAHVSRDDLTSAGLTALMKAAQAFEADRGVPFTRYAASRIRGAILDELRGIDWASRSVRRRGRDLEAARSSLAAELGRAPEVHEVAARAGMTVAEVENNDGDVARANVLSLQGSEVSFEEVLVSSTPEPSEVLEHRERLEYMVDAIAELPERMRVVVQEYFLAERPMAEIAETLGVTESRISQIRAEALVLLRDAMNSALDPDLVAAHPRPQGCAAQRRSAYFAAVATRHATGRTQTAAVAGIA